MEGTRVATPRKDLPWIEKPRPVSTWRMRSDWNRIHSSNTSALETFREDEDVRVQRNWPPAQLKRLDRKKHPRILADSIRRTTLMGRSFRNGCDLGLYPCRLLTVGILFFMLLGTIAVASFGAKADFSSPISKKKDQTNPATVPKGEGTETGPNVDSGRELPSYVVILDAGSTGTRVYVYSARRDGKGAVHVERASIDEGATSTDITDNLSSKELLGRKGLGHVSREEGTGHLKRAGNNMHSKAYRRVETTPGLARILEHARNPSDRRSDVAVALKPLLAWAEKVVAPHLQPKTPVVLLATGGARALDEREQRTLLQDVEVSLVASSFDAGHGSARILTGEDEAVLGFVALNFVSTSGEKVQVKDQDEPPKEIESSHTAQRQSSPKYAVLDGAVGTIELGGASLEVAVPTKTDVEGVQLSEVVLGGKVMGVYTKTFEGYGLEAAFSRSLMALANDQLGSNGGGAPGNEELQIRHPCLHEGYSQLQTMYFAGDKGKAEWQTDKEAKEEMQEVEVVLKGSPDLPECKRLARNIARMQEDTRLREILEKGIVMPLSGFHVIRHFFKVDSYASWSAVDAQVDEFCSMKWTEVTRNEHFMTETHPQKFCLWGYFGNMVIHDSTALGLKEQQLAPVRGDVPWADGAALLEADRLFRREGKTTVLPMLVTRDESLRMHPTTVRIAIFALSISSVFALLVLSSAGIGPPWLNQILCGSCRSKDGNIFEAGRMPLWASSFSKPKHSRSLSAPGLDYRR